VPDGAAGRADLSVRTRNSSDEGKRTPVHVVWELTLACNLKCVHCGSRAGRARPNELSTQECLEVVHQLRDLGTREISIIGGEAYLRRDWLEIVAAISQAGMRCSLQTGARAFTPQKIAAARAAGLVAAGVSVDGPPDVHDRLRGVPGSFERCIEAIRNLAAVGIRPGVNTQINRLSMARLGELYPSLRDAGFKLWQLQLTVPSGNASDREDLIVQPYELPALYDEIARLYLRAQADGVQIFAGNNVGYFGPHEHLWRTVTGEPEAWEACQAAQTTLALEADGTVKGCPALHKDVYGGGSIRERPLAAAWDEMAGEVRRRVSPPLSGFCGSCYYASRCGGGCTWTAGAVMGTPGNNPFCDYRARTLARAGLRERLVLVGASPGEPFDSARWTLLTETLDGLEAPADAVPRGPAAPADAPDQLFPCASCNQFLFAGEETCVHCGTAVAAAPAQAPLPSVIAMLNRALEAIGREDAACQAELTAIRARSAAEAR